MSTDRTRIMVSVASAPAAVSTVLLIAALVGSTARTVRSTTHSDDDHPDRVRSLPGWRRRGGDGGDELPSAWYSGYLDYALDGVEVRTHYVLVDAETDDEDEDETNNKPLFYWSNGGPGASSLFGLFTEIGPLVLRDDDDDDDDDGAPSLRYNPYGWTRLGSLLVIDQPAPVGFSYCVGDDDDDDDASRRCGDVSWTDESASANAHAALTAFFERFPRRRGTDLYLTGESYAGVYVATLARRILENDDGSSSSLGDDLRGLVLGDACLGRDSGSCGAGTASRYWRALFLAGHHQAPSSASTNLSDRCRHRGRPDFLRANSTEDRACQEAIEEVLAYAGDAYYRYHLYDDCPYASEEQRRRRRRPPRGGALDDCPRGGGSALSRYLGLASVKKALRVSSDFFQTDDAEGLDYVSTERDLVSFVRSLVAGEHRHRGVRVLVYNGDADPSITSLAAQNWTSHLGLDRTEPWRPWTLDGCRRTGGYVERYENGALDFLTVRGSGHMVPTHKPAATLAFLRTWLRGDDYPRFDANCERPPPSSRTKTIE